MSVSEGTSRAWRVLLGFWWKLYPITFALSSAPNAERAGKQVGVCFPVILVSTPASTAINLLQFVFLRSVGWTKADHGFKLLSIFRAFRWQSFERLPHDVTQILATY